MVATMAFYGHLGTILKASTCYKLYYWPTHSTTTTLGSQQTDRLLTDR